MTKIRNKQIKFDSDLSFTSLKKIINLANGAAANDAVNLSQLQAVQALISNFEWQPSVLTTTKLEPIGFIGAEPVIGGRYLINGVGAGDWAGKDNQIAEWDGVAWIYTIPTVGTFVSSDNQMAEGDRLYLFGGTSWTVKYFEVTTASTGLQKVGFDIQLDLASATFIEGAQDAVGSSLADTATINFTYNDGANSITADLVAGSVSEVFLQGLGIGANGEILTSNGTGGFAWTPLSSIQDSEKRITSVGIPTVGDAQALVPNVFGAFNPRTNTIPQVFINGILLNVAANDAARTTSECYFGVNAGFAVSLNSLDGTEHLWFNGIVAGYDLDAADKITVHFTV